MQQESGLERAPWRRAVRWWSCSPCPGLRGSDTRPYFSCGLHTVLLQSGSLPLCQPSPFKSKRHAWFHTWKIYVIGLLGHMQCIYNSKQNTLRPVSSVSPQFPPEEMYFCTYSETQDQENRPNTAYHSCYILYISRGCSNAQTLLIYLTIPLYQFLAPAVVLYFTEKYRRIWHVPQFRLGSGRRKYHFHHMTQLLISSNGLVYN